MNEPCGVCYRRMTLKLCGCGCERMVCGRCHRKEKGKHVVGVHFDGTESRATYVPREHYDAIKTALEWIHVHLGSECDWDEIDDDSMEGRWYRDVAKMLERTTWARSLNSPGDIPMDRLRPPVNPGPIIPAKQGMHSRRTK